MRRTRLGIVYKPGDVVLANIQFIDTFDVKTRPAVVLLEEFGNFVVAGVTSSKEMEGIPLTRHEGMIKDSVIKLNYIFTISELMVKKRLFHLSNEKKRIIFEELAKKLSKLKE